MRSCSRALSCTRRSVCCRCGAVRVEVRTLLTLQAFVKPGGVIFLFRGPSGPESPDLVPPLRWVGTYRWSTRCRVASRFCKRLLSVSTWNVSSGGSTRLSGSSGFFRVRFYRILRGSGRLSVHVPRNPCGAHLNHQNSSPTVLERPNRHRTSKNGCRTRGNRRKPVEPCAEEPRRTM